MKRLTTRVSFLLVIACLLLSLQVSPVALFAQDVPTETPVDVIPATETPLPTATVEIPTETTTPEILPSETAIPTETPVETLPPEMTETVVPEATAEPGLPAVPTFTPTPIAAPVLPALTLVVDSNFDNSDLSLWQFGLGWALNPMDAGGMALRVYNSDEPGMLANAVYADVVLQAQVQVDYGTARLYARQTGSNGYMVELTNTGEVILYRSGSVVASATVPVIPGQWRTLSLSVMGGSLYASVDDIYVIAFDDIVPLPAGQIAFGGHFEPLADGSIPVPPANTLLVDNVKLWIPDGTQALPASATPLPSPTAVPTATTTPTPPALPPAPEPITKVLVQDDFETDLSKYWATASPATFIPAINGQALHVSDGNARLNLAPLADLALQSDIKFESSTATLVLRESTAGNYRGVVASDGTAAIYRSDVALASIQLAALPNGWHNLRFSVFGDSLRLSVDGAEVLAVRDAQPLPAGSIVFAAAGEDGLTLDNVIVSVVDENGGIALMSPPINDDFDSAEVVASLPYTVTALDTTEATVAADDPTISCVAQNRRNRSVWYRFTPVENSSVIVHTQGSNYDTTLAIYTGTRGALTSVACDDDSGGAGNTSSITLPVTAGVTYYIMANSYGVAGGTMNLTIMLPPPPANDAFASATTVSFLSYFNTVNTGTATSEVDDPDPTCAPDADYNSVWYRYTPAGAGAISIYMTNSGFDGVLAVYTGTQGSLTEVACRDNSAAGIAEELALLLTANTTYSILLASDEPGGGSMSIDIDALPPPSNDAIASATAISFLNYSTFGLNTTYATGAGTDPDPTCAPGPEYHTVWYTYTTTAGGALSFSTTGGVFDVVLAVYTGAPNALVEVACSDNAQELETIELPVVSGTAYTILVASDEDTGGAITFNLSSLPVPANDQMSGARVITTLPYTHTVNTTYATLSTTDPDPSCAPGPEARTVWYSYTPAGDTSVKFSTASGSFDAVLVVYSGTPAALVALACSDGTVDVEQVNLNLKAATTYYVMIASDGATGGSITLNVAVLTPPAPGAAPVLNLLADNAITSSTTPTFTWGIIAGSDLYDIQIDDSNLFNSPVYSLSLNTNTFTPSDDLPPLKYYWRVRATSGAGEGPWSAIRSFTVDTTPPVAPGLVTPADAAVVSSVKPVLTWLASAGAVDYRLEVATDANFTTKVVSDDDDNATTPTSYTFAAIQVQRPYFWRVQAVDAAGNWSTWSVVRTYTVNISKTPLNQQVITSAVAIPVTFMWNPIAGATSYQLQISTSATFSGIYHQSAVLAGTATSYTTTISLPLGIYYWRVNSNPTASSTGGWWKFTISPAPLVAPTLLTATALITGDSTPDLSWTALSGAATYELQVDNLATFASPEVNKTGITVTGQTLPISLPDGAYNWRVRGVNAWGIIGAWSAARTFTIDTVSPAAPVLAAPAANAISTSITPALSWTAAVGANRYRVEVATDADFTALALPAQEVTAVILPLPPMPQRVYWWRVAARDAAGNWGRASASRSFTVSLLKTPANNAVITAAASAQPAFTWTAVTGATFTLEVSTDSGFGSLAYTCTVTVLTCTPALAQALPHGIYFWRVNVALGATSLPSALSQKFTISPAPLVAPTPVTITGMVTNNSTPDLSWNTLAGAATYDLQVDNLATFASPEANLTGITLTTQTLPNSLPDGLYNWRVRGVNAWGIVGAWSLTRTFTIDTIAPAAPVLAAPAANAVLPTLTPVLSWAASVGANRYRVEVATDTDFTTPALPAQEVTTVTLTLPPLTQRSYWWRVAARDAAGNWSAPGAARSFTLNLLKTPTSNQVFTAAASAQPAFTWTAVTGATFTLEVSTDSLFSTLAYTCTVTVVTCTPTAAQALPHGIYFWHVNVTVGAVSLPSILSQKFTISPAPLVAPTPVTATGLFTSNTTPDLSWNTLAGAAAYELQVDNLATFASPEVNLTGITGTTETLPNSLPDGLYNWRVRGVNQWGIVGAWSLTRTFTIDTVAPAAPVLAAPAANAILTSITPALSWTAAVGANRYRVEVATDADFTALALPVQEAATVTLTLPPLAQNVYWWRVSSRDAAGNWSQPGAARSFTLSLLKTPTGNSVIISATPARPAFTWYAATGATGYQLQIASDTAFNTIVRQVSLGAVLTYTPPVGSELQHGVYYWRVNVLTPAVVLSNIYAKLTISPTPPAAPTFPVSGGTPAITNNTGPDLIWNTVSGTVTYEVQVDNTANFSSPEFSLSATAAPPQTITPALAEGVYNWRVRAVNEWGVPGAWSALRPLTIDTTAPAAPALTLPVANGVDSTLKPVFTWAAVAGATGYLIDIASDADFNTLVINAQPVATLNFTPATPLTQSPYWWRVRARDAAGNIGTPGTGRPLLVSLLKTPANNAYIVTASTALPTFTWAALATGGGYVLQVASDVDFTNIVYTSPNLPAATLSHTLPAAAALSQGWYYWRVNPVNAVEPSRAALRLGISPLPPVSPTFPAVGGTPAFTLDATPTLIWNGVLYDGPLTYDIQVDNNVDFKSPEFTLSGINGTSGEVTIALPKGRYYWRVRAVNQFGATGEWTKARLFTIPIVTNAGIQGRVLDANEAEIGNTVPIVGATVRDLSTGTSVLTDSQGYFTFLGLPPGETAFDFDASTATPAGFYGAYRSKAVLHDNEVIQFDRPIFIMKLDPASATVVNPSATTIVNNPNIDVALTIPPNTVKNAATGQNFTGVMTVSEVPANFTPGTLPANLDPGMVVSIQPMGLTFTAPVPITFPNNDNLAPGTEVDFWSMDHSTGRFFVAGRGRVTPDGTTITTIEGGVRESSWHFPMPAQPATTPATDGPVDNNAPGGQCPMPVSSMVTPHNGCLQTSFALPGYASLGSQHGLEFNYHSIRAYPEMIIPFNSTIATRSAVPPSMSYQLVVAGTPQGSPVFMSTTGLSESVDETIRAATSFDASTMATGVYPYNINLTSHYAASALTTNLSGQITIVNTTTSPFGAGWEIAGLQRLHVDGANMLVVDGDGSYQMFQPAPLDLSTWTRQGVPSAGNWIVAPDSKSVLQTVNGDPTMFVSSQNYINTTIRGRFRVGNHNDIPGDYIGFVMGYQAPLAANGDPTNKYSFLVFDWKQGTQTLNSSNGQEGFALARVNGVITNPEPGFWGRENSPGYELLATDYGPGKGWANNTDYDFELTYSASRILIKVNGNTIFDVAGTFDTGKFGFYNYSQEQVTYSNFSSADLAMRFEGPNGEFSTLVKNPDGSYTRTYTDGSFIRFNVQGFMVATVDTNGNTTAYAYDANNRLISITDATGLVTRLAYGANGKIATVTDPANRITTFVYDAAGNLTRANFPDGTNEQFGYDVHHLMTSETDRRGNIKTRTYDAFGRLVEATLPGNIHRLLSNSQEIGLGTTAVVRPSQALATVSDGMNRTTTVRPGTLGRPVAVTDSAGLTTTISRDADGNPTGTTLPSGAIYDQTYDANGNLLTFRDRTVNPSGTPLTMTYEPTFNNVVSVKDPFNNITGMTYDNRGNLTGIASPMGRDSQFTYNARGQVATSTDELGMTTRYDYDARGNVVQVTEGIGSPEQRITLLTYTPAGYISTITDPLGRVFSYSYDAMGRITTETLPGGRTIAYSYDAAGAMTSVTPPGRPAHTFGYTPLDLVSAYTMPAVAGGGTNQTTYAYNDAQQPTLITRPDGQTIGFGYDTAGRLNGLTIARGAITMTYDTAGRVSTVNAPGGVNLTYAYSGELMTGATWSGPVTGSVSQSIDANYRTSWLRVNNTAQVNYVYNADSQITSTSGVGAAYSLTYAADTGLPTTTSQGGVNEAFNYNAFGDATNYNASYGLNVQGHWEGTQAGGSNWNMTADFTQTGNSVTGTTYYVSPANPNLWVRYTIAGSVSGGIFTYTEQSVLESSGGSWCIKNINFSSTSTYQLAGTWTSAACSPTSGTLSLQRVSAPTVGSSTTLLNTVYTRDSLGRIATLTETTPSQYQVISSYPLFSAHNTYTPPSGVYGTAQVQVTVTAGDRVVLSSTPDGQTGFIVDDYIRLAGQTTSLCQGAPDAYVGTACFSNVLLSGPNPNLPATSVQVPISPVNVTTRIPVGTNTIGFELFDTGVQAGNTAVYLVVLRAPVSPTQTTTYAYVYDAAGRLREVTRNGATWQRYTYDANGNRLTFFENGNTVSATYDNQDRLLTYGVNSYTYNANGDLTSKTAGVQTTSYVYDELGNLMQATLPNGNIVNYLVDGENHRVRKLINGVATKSFLWQDDLRVIAELNTASAVLSRFVYVTGENVPDYMVQGSTTYRIITDHLGSVRLVVNVSNGVIIQRMDYDAFGNVILDTNPGFQPFGFAGGLYDPDTKLVRFGARDYDASIGRWTRKDPIGFSGGDTNLYSYIVSDPINAIDPSGYWSITATVHLGIGLSVTYGESAGYSYVKVGTGVGLSAGLSYDNDGSFPSPQYGGPISGAYGYVSCGAQASVRAGPFSAGVSQAAAGAFITPDSRGIPHISDRDFNTTPQYTDKLAGKGWGLKAGASGGVEGGIRWWSGRF